MRIYKLGEDSLIKEQTFPTAKRGNYLNKNSSHMVHYGNRHNHIASFIYCAKNAYWSKEKVAIIGRLPTVIPHMSRCAYENHLRRNSKAGGRGEGLLGRCALVMCPGIAESMLRRPHLSGFPNTCFSFPVVDVGVIFGSPKHSTVQTIFFKAYSAVSNVLLFDTVSVHSLFQLTNCGWVVSNNIRLLLLCLKYRLAWIIVLRTFFSSFLFMLIYWDKEIYKQINLAVYFIRNALKTVLWNFSSDRLSMNISDNILNFRSIRVLQIFMLEFMNLSDVRI